MKVRASQRLLSITAMALLAACGSGHTLANSNGGNEPVNTLINGIPTLPVQPGEGMTPSGSPLTSTETLDGTSFSCQTQGYTESENADQVAALNPNADVLWPGSVIQGASIVSGTLDPVPSLRAPGTITLALATGGTQPYSQVLAQPSLASATNAINQILSGVTQATPAKFSYDVQNTYSEDQLAFQLNADAKWLSPEVKASLGFSTDKQYQRVIVNLSQEYYTMAFDPPSSAASFFDPTVTPASLAPYTGQNNPLTYVSSVTYGRQYVFLFESQADQDTLSAAVSATFQLGLVGINAGVDASYKKVVDNARVKVFALGGNAQDALAGATGNFDAVTGFITKGANFGPNQPGAPLSYTLRYVKDSTVVRVNLATSFQVKSCVPTSVPTEDFDVKVGQFYANSACHGPFWFQCGQFYWSLYVDVVDRAGTVLRSWPWGSRNRETGAKACPGSNVDTSLDEVRVNDVPLTAGTCLKPHGAVYEANDSGADTFVGDFFTSLCYDGQNWAGLGSASADINSGTCGSGAKLDYSINKIH